MNMQVRELSLSYKGRLPKSMIVWRVDFREMPLSDVINYSKIDEQFYPYGYRKAIFNRKSGNLHLYKTLDVIMDIWNNHTVGGVTTHFEYPPIPSRQYDWFATRDGYDEGDPIGHGAKRKEAIEDLLNQEEEKTL